LNPRSSLFGPNADSSSTPLGPSADSKAALFAAPTSPASAPSATDTPILGADADAPSHIRIEIVSPTHESIKRESVSPEYEPTEAGVSEDEAPSASQPRPPTSALPVKSEGHNVSPSDDYSDNLE
jgi:hypothetical protein